MVREKEKRKNDVTLDYDVNMFLCYVNLIFFCSARSMRIFRVCISVSQMMCTRRRPHVLPGG